jgi:hypothetical protein
MLLPPADPVNGSRKKLREELPHVEREAGEHRIAGNGLRIVEANNLRPRAIDVDVPLDGVDKPSEFRPVVHVLLHFLLQAGKPIAWGG